MSTTTTIPSVVHDIALPPHLMVETWASTMDAWERQAMAASPPVRIGGPLQSVAPRVKLVPTSGAWAETVTLPPAPAFPVVWPRRLPTDLGTSALVLQVAAAGTYASLLTQRPIIRDGACQASQETAFLQALTSVAALRCGVVLASGVLPVNIHAASENMVEFAPWTMMLYMRGTARCPAEYHWLTSLRRVMSAYKKALAPAVLNAIAYLGPAALAAGVMLRMQPMAQVLGRAQAARVAARISEIYGGRPFDALPWAIEAVAAEVAGAFPEELGMQLVSDAALSEAIGRCFPCSDAVFQQSVLREAALRAHAEMAPTMALALDMPGVATVDQDDLSELFSEQSSAPTTRAPTPVATDEDIDRAGLFAEITAVHAGPLQAATAHAIMSAQSPLAIAMFDADLPAPGAF